VRALESSAAASRASLAAEQQRSSQLAASLNSLRSQVGAARSRSPGNPGNAALLMVTCLLAPGRFQEERQSWHRIVGDERALGFAVSVIHALPTALVVLRMGVRSLDILIHLDIAGGAGGEDGAFDRLLYAFLSSLMVALFLVACSATAAGDGTLAVWKAERRPVVVGGLDMGHVNFTMYRVVAYASASAVVWCAPPPPPRPPLPLDR
jgi:hypothetical protein